MDQRPKLPLPPDVLQYIRDHQTEMSYRNLGEAVFMSHTTIYKMMRDKIGVRENVLRLTEYIYERMEQNERRKDKKYYLWQ